MTATAKGRCAQKPSKVELWRQPKPLWFFPAEAEVSVAGPSVGIGFTSWRGSFKVWWRP